MKKLLKVFEYKGEKYEIVLVKRPDGIFFLKDFNGGIPFSPFYYCIHDLGYINISEIEIKFEQPVLDYLMSQSEEGTRYWADNKTNILGYMSN